MDKRIFNSVALILAIVILILISLSFTLIAVKLAESNRRVLLTVCMAGLWAINPGGFRYYFISQ